MAHHCKSGFPLLFAGEVEADLGGAFEVGGQDVGLIGEAEGDDTAGVAKSRGGVGFRTGSYMRCAAVCTVRLFRSSVQNSRISCDVTSLTVHPSGGSVREIAEAVGISQDNVSAYVRRLTDP